MNDDELYLSRELLLSLCFIPHCFFYRESCCYLMQQIKSPRQIPQVFWREDVKRRGVDIYIASVYSTVSPLNRLRRFSIML